MKECTKCKEIKDYSFYSLKKTCKDGYASICKNCVKEYSKNHYNNNKEKRSEQVKNYREKNKDFYKQYHKLWFQKNKEKINEKRRENRSNNISNINQKEKLYRLINKEKLNKKSREYAKNNRERINKRSREYENKRMNEDLLFKFKKRVRDNVLKSFKRGVNQYQKNAKTETILGCTIEEFKIYIQSKFKKGMNFKNIGEWHLDHIIPLYTAKTEEEIIRLNHYTNFQPLWADENIKKSNKIIETQLILI
jgi:hypothetical protein